MYDMSQFVVVVPVPDESSAILASYFMQHVLMKFGLCHLVVFDDGTPFKELSGIKCQLRHSCSIHRFLNKSVTIAAGERGTTNIFVPAGIAVGYARNSVPIDGTDILRSIPAIGRELKFPLYINLNAMPKLVQNNANAVLEYLKLTDSSRSFSSSILKILSKIVGSLMLSASIILEILLFCMTSKFLWLVRLFRVIFPNIKLQS